MSLQNLTDDECSEDKMNNLKFYLNQFPSAPDGNYQRSNTCVKQLLFLLLLVVKGLRFTFLLLHL